MGKFEEWMSGWKAGDFFRQLATVVIGIIITFGGSGLIQKSAQKKEARHLLEMVRQELRDNAIRATKQAEWFGYLKDGAKALRPYIDDPGTAPVDSLLKYANISSSKIYTPSTDAFEIFKSSDAIKAIKDKQFVLDLFSTYDQIAAGASNVRSYNEMKVEEWDDYYKSVERNMVETVFGETNPVTVFVHAVGSPYIARYIIETAKVDWLDGLIDEHEQLAVTIEEMATKIEQQIL